MRGLDGFLHEAAKNFELCMYKNSISKLKNQKPIAVGVLS
jgi:hypothetical protein